LYVLIGSIGYRLALAAIGAMPFFDILAAWGIFNLAEIFFDGRHEAFAGNS
jgi:hypothetical protein